MRRAVMRFLGNQSGSAAFETGMMMVVAAGLVLVGFNSIGTRVKGSFDKAMDQAFTPRTGKPLCKDLAHEDSDCIKD